MSTRKEKAAEARERALATRALEVRMKDVLVKSGSVDMREVGRRSGFTPNRLSQIKSQPFSQEEIDRLDAFLKSLGL
jgi:hypothetical protein